MPIMRFWRWIRVVSEIRVYAVRRWEWLFQYQEVKTGRLRRRRHVTRFKRYCFQILLDYKELRIRYHDRNVTLNCSGWRLAWSTEITVASRDKAQIPCRKLCGSLKD